MTDKDSKYLDQLSKHFDEYAIRLDQSSKDGRTILSTKTASDLCQSIAGLVRVVKRINVPKP